MCTLVRDAGYGDGATLPSVQVREVMFLPAANFR